MASGKKNFVQSAREGWAVAILGCAHSGITSNLTHITAQLPGKPIHTIINGTSCHSPAVKLLLPWVPAQPILHPDSHIQTFTTSSKAEH